MHIALVSLFPEMFAAVSDYGVTGRAAGKGSGSSLGSGKSRGGENQQARLQLSHCNPRDYTDDTHRTVDDRPYGGGPGMVMKVEPLFGAIGAAKTVVGESAPVIYLSPQGQRFDHQRACELAQQSALILVAGRYEGIDERLLEEAVDEELSIGDYVISGGELAAMVVIDAIARQLPGVLGHEESAANDSFVDGLLDCPHYTRPEAHQGRAVPPVLLSGNHEAIRRWRLQQALGRTFLRRPDLLDARGMSKAEQDLLAEFLSDIECQQKKR